MDFKELVKSGNYVDTTNQIMRVIKPSRRWSVIADSRPMGKTTFLSMLYYYFDEDIDSKELFENTNLAEEFSEWEKYLNKYSVVCLDFTDFDEKSFEGAIKYIEVTMKNLYILSAQKLFPTGKLDNYNLKTCLDILKEDVTVERLEYSLKNLLYILRTPSSNSYNVEDRPVLLIDNIIKLEMKAKEYNYYEEMKGFLNHFLGFEPDKMCAFFFSSWR